LPRDAMRKRSIQPSTGARLSVTHVYCIQMAKEEEEEEEIYYA